MYYIPGLPHDFIEDVSVTEGLDIISAAMSTPSMTGSSCRSTSRGTVPAEVEGEDRDITLAATDGVSGVAVTDMTKLEESLKCVLAVSSSGSDLHSTGVKAGSWAKDCLDLFLFLVIPL